MRDIRESIEIVGARQNNLKDISVEIPRDKLTVITGVSGSGKSSLAFDIVYGEAQRRFLKSLSNFAKSRIGQVKKPDVDFVRGLSPVIAIEQKKGNNNPRSTVGTVTDVNDYLRLLFAEAGTGACPVCGQPLEPVDAARLAERICKLPEGTEVMILTPAHKVYGEDYAFLFGKIRDRGYKHLVIDGAPFALSEKDQELDESREYRIEVVLERLVASEAAYLQTAKSIEALMAAMEDDLLWRIHAPGVGEAFFREMGCAAHGYLLCETHPHHFSFNVSTSACDTCGGVGTSHTAEPRFMVANPQKSILKGALHASLFNTRSHSGREVLLYSVAQKYGFSLDTPFHKHPQEVLDILFHGAKGEIVELIQPPFMQKRHWSVGRKWPFPGLIREMESWYRHYLRRASQKEVHEPSFVKEAMVDSPCPDCGGARLKASQLRIAVGGRSIHELCTMPFPELIDFLEGYRPPAKLEDAVRSIVREITSRLRLLADIGLHYLCLDRRSDSISGGEMQRIKMSTQISSELMGMLYVMDEPTIGLHPRDSGRIISILRRLRDIGNTVIVVEHDLDTIRSADHLIEVGPGAGAHGGTITAFGAPDAFAADERSLTGAYMSGRRGVAVPERRRLPTDLRVAIQGARENNLRGVSVDIPLGLFVCVTGVSGSGKSTLVFETLAKNLEVLMRGSRIVPGKLDFITGYEALNNVIIIDQSPIGRSSKSNPATYVGIYGRIRKLFASTPEAVARGYTELDFSLTHAGGTRCEHCTGDGVIVTNLQFMADIESVCPLCKGRRFSPEGMEMAYHGKNIADVLDMTIEEALAFFADEPLIRHKLSTMRELGLGYMTLGQSATTLSGGEAQRVKLSYELGKIKRGNHNLYILDEPTTGLHCADVENLLESIQRLVDKGHSVLVVEHNLDVMKAADYIIDMGPEGGWEGGYVVAAGTPEEVARAEGSYTGRHLREVLG